MALGAFRISSPLPASAARVYAAWLDTREHSLMTGAPATVDPAIGGRHTAWDGYIEGETLELEPERRIVQSWRSTAFPADHPASRLEIRLRDVPGGCEISIAHSEIPECQAEKYEAGWHEHYFIPMTRYFRETADALSDAPTVVNGPEDLLRMALGLPPEDLISSGASVASSGGSLGRRPGANLRRARKPKKAAPARRSAKAATSKARGTAKKPAPGAKKPAKAKQGQSAKKSAKKTAKKVTKKTAKKVAKKTAKAAKRPRAK